MPYERERVPIIVSPPGRVTPSGIGDSQSSSSSFGGSSDSNPMGRSGVKSVIVRVGPSPTPSLSPASLYKSENSASVGMSIGNSPWMSSPLNAGPEVLVLPLDGRASRGSTDAAHSQHGSHDVSANVMIDATHDQMRY